MPIEAPSKLKAKSKNLTWTQVKKHIEHFSQASLLDLVHQLYELNDLNKAFLTVRFQPDATFGSKELNTLRRRVYQMMNPDITHANSYPKLEEARQIITDYEKTKDTLGTLDLMLTYVEAGNDFTCEYGDIDEEFYIAVETVLDDFAKLFQVGPDKYMVYFNERLKDLSKSASGIGWGYGDAVTDTVEELGVWEYNPEEEA